MNIKWIDWLYFFREILNLNGGACERFINALKLRLKVKHVYLLASGRDAIMISLRALGLKEGDEILIPSYTLGELIPLLQKQRYILKAVDVCRDTYTIDPVDLKKKISQNTKCVMVTHLLGAPCDMESILAIAKKWSVPILEDCAHAFGAKMGENYIGTLGDIGIFSFETNKTLPTYGGGAIITHNSTYAKEIESLMVGRVSQKIPIIKKMLLVWLEEIFVRSPFFSFVSQILFSPKIAPIFEKLYRAGQGKARKNNVCYSNFQAMVGLNRLSSFDQRQQRLQSLFDEISVKLPKNIFVQKRNLYGTAVFYNMVVLVKSPLINFRKKMIKHGFDVGIGSEVMDDCSEILGSDDCPVSREIFHQAVILPVHDGLSVRNKDRLISFMGKIHD